MDQLQSYTQLPKQALSFRLIFAKIKTYIIISNLLFTIAPLLVYLFFKKAAYQNLHYFQNSQPISYAISFDGLHFLYNQYTQQINYAFLPGFVFLRIFYTYIFNNQKQLIILALIITNKILTCLSSIELFRIAYQLTYNQKIAKIVAIVFIFSPASIFYHVVYSEALYTFIIFTAIRLFLKNKKQSQSLIEHPIQYLKINIISLLLFLISGSIRTTSMFYSILPGLDILKKFFKSLKQLRVITSLKIFITGLSTLLFFLLFFIVYLYYAKLKFCDSSGATVIGPQFCKDQLPNIYSYIQTKYWQVGFFNYYQLKHAFQIAMGVPSLIIALMTLKNTINVWTELTISYWILLFITICYTVIQSSARFFSTNPIYNIYLVLFLQKEKNFNFKQKLVIFYLICYNILGIILFSVRCSWI